MLQIEALLQDGYAVVFEENEVDQLSYVNGCSILSLKIKIKTGFQVFLERLKFPAICFY